ncbi:hypothetical protein TrST_g14333 [Triparma strigata]|uniref:Uncharacterized protein n=1 Tax=Triparma strigata TaxID=1606541 RepID=A0A9W7ARD3_9STRA|nr:hypothetical protein TrST_g14333 [Triparma strigata]
MLLLCLLLLVVPHSHQLRLSPIFSTVRSKSSNSSPPINKGPKSPPAPFLQVLTDIDDTLKSSGGLKVADVALGGVDAQYPRGTVYPGVFPFILELSLHPLSRTSSVQTPMNPAVLTARAEEFKAALEIKPTSAICLKAESEGLSRLGVPGWGIGPVLYGSVAEWVNQVNKGFRKFKNFEQLKGQGFEFVEYVYLGDTGEYDEEAGVQMLRYYPEKVKGVFLHVVGETLEDRERVRCEEKIVNGRPVMYFRTYIGAAVKAYRNSLMGEEGVERVIESVYRDLKGMGIGEDDQRWRDAEREEEEWRYGS